MVHLSQQPENRERKLSYALVINTACFVEQITDLSCHYLLRYLLVLRLNLDADMMRVRMTSEKRKRFVSVSMLTSLVGC